MMTVFYVFMTKSVKYTHKMSCHKHIENPSMMAPTLWDDSACSHLLGPSTGPPCSRHNWSKIDAVSALPTKSRIRYESGEVPVPTPCAHKN